MLVCDLTGRSEESKTNLLAQLREMVQEMRSIPPPQNMRVANVAGGILYDMGLPGLSVTYPVPTSNRYGPFDDVPTLNKWLVRFAENDRVGERPEIEELLRI